MPNAFAYIAIFAWPLVAFVLFRTMSRPAAIIWTIVGGYLLLPTGVGVNFPMLPTIDKTLVPALSATVFCFVLRDNTSPMRRAASQPTPSPTEPRLTAASPRVGQPRRTTERPLLGRPTSRPRPAGAIVWVERILLGLMILGPLATALQNADPVPVGPRWLPGLTLYDGLSMVLSALVALVPYLLARRFLVDHEHQVLLLKCLCVAGLLYSLPTLFEIRMSPQLSNWTYGFLFQSFAQAVRDGGFRPAVFVQSGLWLAIFLAMAIVAAVALARETKRQVWFPAAAWLLLTLALCRSLGALGIAIALLPAAAVLRPRPQVLISAIVAVAVIVYPALRGGGLVPLAEITSIAASISEDRAGSLNFRLENEDILLSRANERPLTGWGGWGRSRVFNESGKDISITDGTWILIIGSYGWLGYLGLFGLLTLPTITLAVFLWRRRLSMAASGLTLVLAANLIDLIPNATLTPLTWLAAGTLMTVLHRTSAAGTAIHNSASAAAIYKPIRRRTPANLR